MAPFGLDCFAPQSHGCVWSVQTMQMETKFLRLCQPAALGEQIDGWKVYWVGGWGRDRKRRPSTSRDGVISCYRKKVFAGGWAIAPVPLAVTSTARALSRLTPASSGSRIAPPGNTSYYRAGKVSPDGRWLSLTTVEKQQLPLRMGMENVIGYMRFLASEFPLRLHLSVQYSKEHRRRGFRPATVEIPR